MVIEGIAQTNGPRIAPLVYAPEGPDVEVIRAHITRAKIKPGIWPRHYDIEHLPKSVRPVVETPDGVDCPVHVALLVLEGYVYAHGHQDYICRGEDVTAGGAFPRECELRAERIALEML